MCSRYQVPEEAEIARHYHIKLQLPTIKPVIYPGYSAPVIAGEPDLRAAEVRFWGFVARFPGKRDPGSMIEKIMQNAVSETIDEKRTFSGAWKANQRCIIPVKYFMEPKNKTFVPIYDPSADVMSMAGIWGETTHKGEKHAAFTMLTCEPNAFMEPFHDRMPVILKPDDVEEWLSSDTTPEQAKKLCRPFTGKLTFKE